MKRPGWIAWVRGGVLVVAAGLVCTVNAESAPQAPESPAHSAAASPDGKAEPAKETPPPESIDIAALPAHPVATAKETALPSDVTPGSVWFRELAKLARAGIEESVLLTYVESAGTFQLTSDQIIYLRDLGVSGGVLSTVLQHDADISAGRKPANVTVLLPAEPLLPLASLAKPPAPVEKNPPKEQTPSREAEPTEKEPPALESPQEPFYFWGNYAIPLAPIQEDNTGVYRVRAPYAVQLVEPILVYRADPRRSNLSRLVLFP